MTATTANASKRVQPCNDSLASLAGLSASLGEPPTPGEDQVHAGALSPSCREAKEVIWTGEMYSDIALGKMLQE